MTQRDAVDVAAVELRDRLFPEPTKSSDWSITDARRADALDAIAEALRSASNSGAEAMREAVQADLSAYIDKNEARIAANPYEMQDRILLEERVMALDAARSRVAKLPLPAPGAPASPWRVTGDEA